jgi:glutathione S-transferase
LHHIDISTHAQKELWYLRINPNGKIPALVHQRPDGSTVRLFESGSMLLYLIENFDPQHKLSYPRGTPEHWEMINWLFFQTSGLGPMQGQAHHFLRYAPEKVPYAMDRYSREVRRVYGVLEAHLQDTGASFLVGQKLTICDISAVTWVIYAKWAKVDMADYPYLKMWRDRVIVIPEVAQGLKILKPLDIEVCWRATMRRRRASGLLQKQMSPNDLSYSHKPHAIE